MDGAQNSKDSYRQLTHCSDVISIKLKLCDCIAASYCSGKAYQWNLGQVSNASAEEALERERETEREKEPQSVHNDTNLQKSHCEQVL